MKPVLLSVFAGLASVATAQRIVLPDNQNFMESPTYGACFGDTAYWRATPGRFQVVYDASHFTHSRTGITGPITITRLKFRGEDGEANLGGQVYTGVTVELGSTSLTGATMGTNFATNRAPATTTMGAPGTATVTLAPSIGSCPNNYHVDIDLAAIGASFVFDPFSVTQPNLIVDITMPTAPTNAPPLALIQTQDAIAHGAGVRGRSITTATVGAAAGAADPTPPIVGLEFTGGGGYTSEVPATAEYIGAGCGGDPSTVYQEFWQWQSFDLAGGFTLTPDVYPGPTRYTVTAGAGAFDATALNVVPDSAADDAVVATPLGWSFDFPGGTTTTVVPSTNGFLWLDPAMTLSEFAVSRTSMLGSTGNGTARLLPLWLDMTASKNTGMGTAAGMHVKSVPETSSGAGDAQLVVTWRDMGTFRTPGSSLVYGHAVWNVQCVIHQLTGVVEYRYGTCEPYFSAVAAVYPGQTAAAIVGFTRGRIAGVPSVDPGSRDLSAELPYTTHVEGTRGHVILSAVATPVPGSVMQTGRAFGGQTLTYSVSNVPPPVGVSLVLLSFDVGAIAGHPLTGIAPTGCVTNFATLLPAAFQFAVVPNTVGGTIPISSPALVVPEHDAPGSWATLGLVVTAQAWGVDFGGSNLVPWTSNTIKYVIGLD